MKTLVTDTPLNINFLRYSPLNRFRIPVEYINDEQCVDIKRGCFVIHVNRFIECMCEGDIPRSFKIDLTHAKLGTYILVSIFLSPDLFNFSAGDVFRVSSVKFPPGVRPSANVPPEYVLGVLKSE